MADPKAALTANLRKIRTNLLLKRQELIRQVIDIEGQIAATDRLLKVHDPDHVALPFHPTSAEGAIKRPRVQLPPPPSLQTPPSAQTAQATQTPTATEASVERSGTPFRPAKDHVALRGKLNIYFNSFDKRNAILTALSELKGPAKVHTIAAGLLKKHPIELGNDAPMNIVNSRVSSLLYRLQNHELVSKTEHTNTKGNKIVFWEITALGRSTLRA